ncbi:hypothetical protein ScPMuIL_006771 [Solemya velum]
MIKKLLFFVVFGVSIAAYLSGGMIYLHGERKCAKLEAEWWQPANWYYSEDFDLCRTTSGKLIYGARELRLEANIKMPAVFTLGGFFCCAVFLYSLLAVLVSALQTVPGLDPSEQYTEIESEMGVCLKKKGTLNDE